MFSVVGFWYAFIGLAVCWPLGTSLVGGGSLFLILIVLYLADMRVCSSQRRLGFSTPLPDGARGKGTHDSCKPPNRKSGY